MKTDLSEYRTATLDASQRMGKSLALLQLVTAYAALALLRLNDLDYLLEAGQVLPIINVTVPTEQFLIITPALVCIVHVGTLLQWNLLQARLRRYMSKRVREGLRGADDVESGLTGSLLLAAASSGTATRAPRQRVARALLATYLVALPIGMLVWVLVRSLAYHDLMLTDIHKVLLVIDLVALFTFLSERPFGFSSALERTHAGLAALLLAFVFFDARVPGEDVVELPQRGNLTDLLVRERRLDVSNADITLRKAVSSDAKATDTARLNLTDRDLRFGDFSRATFTGVMLRGANLTGARLISTRFVDSDFQTPAVSKPVSTEVAAPTRLNFAQLTNADFSGQDLSNVQLIGAVGLQVNFAAATLQGTVLTGATLDFSDFRAADLHAADASWGSFIGADFRSASMTQANFTGGDLRGATLFRNRKMFGRFHLADLTFVRDKSLRNADLESLRGAIEHSHDGKATAEKFLSDLREEQAIGTQSEWGTFTYAADHHAFLWARHDYLPFSTTSDVVSMSHSDYVRLFRTFRAKAEHNNPLLSRAMANRSRITPVSLSLLAVRESLPETGEPGSPSLALIRNRLLTMDVLVHVNQDDMKELQDNRYGSAEVPSSKWVDPAFQMLIASMKPDHQDVMKKLRASANAKDDLAFSALAHCADHLVVDAPETLREYLAAQLKTRKFDPSVALAVSQMMPEADPRRVGLLTPWTGQSAAVDWALFRQTKQDKYLNAAADEGEVEAQTIRGIDVYWESKSAKEARAKAWTAIDRAAHRGWAPAQLAIGTALQQAGDDESSLPHLEEAAQAGHGQYLNSLAALLATSPSPAVRNPVRAVEIAQRRLGSAISVPPLQPDSRCLYLDTLASAYAANGDFEHAVDVQREAIRALPASRRTELLTAMTQRLSSFLAKRPWIEYRHPALPETPKERIIAPVSRPAS